MPFPNYTQHDAMDCGPTSLQIVAAFYGKHYSLQNLRDRCHITREGVSLLGISDAAEAIGFRATGVKVSWEQLRDEANLPCIVHWNQQHFVVVYKIARKRGQWWVWVSDPAGGLLKYSEEQFKKAWLQSRELPDISALTAHLSEGTPHPAIHLTGASSSKGIALLLEPTPKFYSEQGDEDARLKISYMLRYLSPYKRYLVQLGIAMLTASIISLILPFLTQSVVDTGIGTGNLSFVVMILIAQVVLMLGQMANNIGVSDEVPDMKRVCEAVEVANIEDFIDGLPLGYNTKIGADGHGLSTGQKQRLLIARAAYKDASTSFPTRRVNRSMPITNGRSWSASTACLTAKPS